MNRNKVVLRIFPSFGTISGFNSQLVFHEIQVGMVGSKMLQLRLLIVHVLSIHGYIQKFQVNSIKLAMQMLQN